MQQDKAYMQCSKRAALNLLLPLQFEVPLLGAEGRKGILNSHRFIELHGTHPYEHKRYEATLSQKQRMRKRALLHQSHQTKESISTERRDNVSARSTKKGTRSTETRLQNIRGDL
jgi:hypothetical protein